MPHIEFAFTSAVVRARSAQLLWPYLLVTAAVLLAFHGTLMGSDHLPYDAELYHFPLLDTIQRALAVGHLPAWNPDSYGGTPLLANAQSAWLYPPHLLVDGGLGIIGRPLTPHLLNVVAVAHVWLAGIGTILLAKHRGMGDAAAAFAGGFVVLFGNTIAQAQHVGMTETLAWLPLALLMVDRLALGVTAPRLVGLAALVALMWSAGFLPLAPAWALLLVGSALLRAEGRINAIGGAVAGISLGLAMAAAMLAPVVALVSSFPPLDPHSSLSTATLVTTIFPNAFGHWLTLDEYTGPGDPTTSYNYVGAGAVLLVPLMLASGRRVLRDAALAVGLLLLSFGTSGQRTAEQVQRLPVIGHLYRPEDVLYVAAIPLALTLAHGLSRPPTLRQLGGLGAFLVILAAIPFSDSHGHSLRLLDQAPRRELLALVVLGGLLVGAALVLRAGRARLAALALALVAGVSVMDLASTVPGRYFVNAPGPVTHADANDTDEGSQVLAFLRIHLRPEDRVASDAAHLPPEWSGFPPIWRLPDVNGFHPQFSKYQLERVHATGADFEGQNRIFPITPKVRPYLDELGVTYVIEASNLDRIGGNAGYRLVFQDATYHVYLVLHARPRSYAVDVSCVHRVGVPRLLRCETGGRVRVAITGQSDRRLQLPNARGFPLLITGEPYYPGWRAQTSGGHPLTVRRVGYLAGLSVPRGTRSVLLSYRPPGLVAGILLTALALAGGAAAVVRSQRRRKRR